MCSVAWPVERRGEGERERREHRATSRDGDRSQAEIRNNVKDGRDGREKLPWFGVTI